MRFENVGGYLDIMGTVPSDAGSLSKWQRQMDVGKFLIESSKKHDVPIYINGQFGNLSVLVYSIIVPIDSLFDHYKEDIKRWSFTCDRKWGYGFREDASGKVTLFPPLSDTGSMILDGGEPFVFHRFLEGDEGDSYINLNQKIEQILGIFWMTKRKAYCRFDLNGDYEEVVKVSTMPDRNFCTIKKQDLDLILFLTNGVLIRVFEFTKTTDLKNFATSGTFSENKVDMNDEEIYCNLNIKIDDSQNYLASWMRGFSIIRNSEEEDKLIRIANGRTSEPEKYETYLAHDIKHDNILEISCNPVGLDSYFKDTGKPLQTSIAFFRPEVLLKYQQYPEKYRLGEDSIYCRGAWCLKRYDTTESGQVNVFLCDLAQMPHSEQTYWKSFNEEPIGPISEKSIRRDFIGEFYSGHNPLSSLTQILNNFPLAKNGENEVAIWSFHGDIERRKTSRLHYVVTESTKEWIDQIIELDTILSDGLVKGNIKKIAERLEIDVEDFGSIILLQKCLEKRNIPEDVIKKIIDPLKKLHKDRSKIGAHGEEEAPHIDLGSYYKDTLDHCDSSMRLLAEIIGEGKLNI